MTEAIAGRSNAASIGNTGEGHFSHFGMIGTNSFGGFGTFRKNNNNPSSENNNNNPSLLLPPRFGEGLEEGFNPPPEGNTGGLDPNVAALVNALTGANLSINYVEKELNHIKPIEF